MEINKIYEEVHDYCYNLILNSKKEDWVSNMIIIDNIKIEIFYNKRFHINIYNDNSATMNRYSTYEFNIDIDYIYCIFNKKLKKLRKKYKEIKFFIENKEKCEKAIQIYNLLPIKELRKKKLNEINNE